MIDAGRLKRMRETFETHFPAQQHLILARAPGRVNLIGEHTDYHGGFVLPMAVELDVAVLGGPTSGRELTLFSMDFNELGRFRPDDLRPEGGRQNWLNYVKGVVKLLAEAGVPIVPCSAVVHATVPIGGGLSSSAAIEVAVATFLLALAGKTLDGVTLARLQQLHSGMLQPRTGVRDCLSHANWSLHDAPVCHDADETEDGDPGQSHRAGSAESPFPPIAHRVMNRRLGVVGVDQDVDVDKNHLNSFFSVSSASSSSASWPSL